MKFIGTFFLWVASLGLIAAIAGVLAIIGIFSYYSHDLPDYSTLKDYEPPVVTRVHAGDGRLLAEFAQENRIFIPSDEIPDLVKNAFLAAEDKNFYTHKGVDPMAIARAMMSNLKNYGTGRRPIGASTITQQVAKNFLLSDEVSYKRKIKEAIVAYRMDKAMDKDRILELYLNEIFLGKRSYGVASAALNYFNKSLDDLNIEEVAYLAALPKAPNNYQPVKNYDAAIGRRNWVIDNMVDSDFITKGEAEIAKLKPLEVIPRDENRIVEAAYFAEEVRREMIEHYGKDSIYKEGLSIRTTIDPNYQNIAVTALRDGLTNYDRRHGWRGPIKAGLSTTDSQAKLAEIVKPEGFLKEWSLAMVVGSGGSIALENGQKGTIRDEDIKWSSSKPLKAGDVVMVEQRKDKTFALKQIPKIQGAIIVIDPHTGRVLAMQGGWKFDNSQYNRTTQAKRQPGSAFKPFIYLTALQEGFTPSTLVLDAPFEYEDRPGHFWRPKNYSDKFYGPTPIRVGVEKSRNLMTVRLAHHIGMDKIVNTAEEFGVYNDLQPHLANSLGAAETTLIDITNGYAMLVNGGRKIVPTLIDRIQNRYGETVYQYDDRKCTNCGPKVRWDNQSVPNIPDNRAQVGDPKTIYQIVSILEGVAERGTAVRLKELNRPLGGKTGTTNESKDAWFIGFSPDMVVGVYMGMDNPKPLGKKETGSSVALPVFKDFVTDALKSKPAIPFRVPEGIKLVRVNPNTGRRVSPLDDSGIWEAFVPGTEPEDRVMIIDDGAISAQSYDTTGQIQPVYPDNPFAEYPETNYPPVGTPPQEQSPTTTGTGGLY